MENRRSKAITFTLTGHAHLDPVWLWDRQEGIETVKATFRSALDRMQENPDLVFAHSSAGQYAWMEIHPELMAEIRTATERGQWEPVGGFWVEPDMNIPSGESLARQGLYGQRFFEKAVGRRCRVAFLPDSFGSPYTLPQIFQQCGMEVFLFWRPVGKELELPANLFWWEGPDGTRMLSARLETYNSNPNNVIVSMEAAIDWRDAGLPEWIVLYGVGNHGGGPTKKAIANMRELATSQDWPTMRLGSIEGFFDRALGRSGAEYPTFREPLQYTFRGCYTSHAGVKKWNRQAEATLGAAEKWSAVATQFGLPYPTARFESAWRHVLFNQFHDIICGTSILSAYEDAQREMGEAIGSGKRTLHEAMMVIAQQIDTRSGEDVVVQEAMRRVRTGPGNAVADLGDGMPVVVFNHSPWPRREVIDVEVNDWHIADMQVLDDQNRPVVHQFAKPEAFPPRKRAAFLAEVPPLGYRVYRIVDRPPAQFGEGAPLLQASATVLENTWWRIELDPRTGAIRSLRDKQIDRELLAGAGAQLLVIDDPWNPWGRGDYFRHLLGAFSEPEIELIENGPVRATLSIKTRWNNSAARQEITLYREIPAIHGKLEIDWHEQWQMVKLAFPFALQETTATFSVPFGHVARPTGGQEEPTQQWLDVTGKLSVDPAPVYNGPPTYGVAVFNDCKYGADVQGGEARLTILRSPLAGGGNRNNTPVRTGDRHLDQGLQTMRWALMPHVGPWQEARVPGALPPAPVVVPAPGTAPVMATAPGGTSAASTPAAPLDPGAGDAPPAAADAADLPAPPADGHVGPQQAAPPVETAATEGAPGPTVPQAAQDFNEPLTFIREYAHAGRLPKQQSFLQIDPPDQFLAAALKQAEDSTDWVLRLHEPHGQPARAEVRIPALGAAFTAHAGPHQVKSYRISSGGTVREVNFLEE